jgi:hypothetical protein
MKKLKDIKFWIDLSEEYAIGVLCLLLSISFCWYWGGFYGEYYNESGKKIFLYNSLSVEAFKASLISSNSSFWDSLIRMFQRIYPVGLLIFFVMVFVCALVRRYVQSVFFKSKVGKFFSYAVTYFLPLFIFTNIYILKILIK